MWRQGRKKASVLGLGKSAQERETGEDKERDRERERGRERDRESEPGEGEKESDPGEEGPKGKGDSVVKIAVPGARLFLEETAGSNRAEVYQRTVGELQHKEELSLSDILRLKELYPFKRREWRDKLKARSKGEKVGRSLRQTLAKEAADTKTEGSYGSIEAARSVYPSKKYCDFTGFRAKYTDKKTGLRYYSHSFYSDICKLSSTVSNQYLELRNAVVTIK